NRQPGKCTMPNLRASLARTAVVTASRPVNRTCTTENRHAQKITNSLSCSHHRDGVCGIPREFIPLQHSECSPAYDIQQAIIPQKVPAATALPGVDHYFPPRHDFSAGESEVVLIAVDNGTVIELGVS